MMYQGLHHNRFYWELINTLRKLLLLSLSVFLLQHSFNYSAISATLILVIILRLQIKLSPYKNESYNSLELTEIITGAFTLFASLLFEDEDQKQPAINLIVFLIMLFVNFRFLILWTYRMA